MVWKWQGWLPGSHFLPFPFPSSLHFSKSCWYNLGHLQHLHLQSVLRSIESYEYFIGQNLSATLELRSRGKEGVLGNAFRKRLQGLSGPPIVSTLRRAMVKKIFPPQGSLSLCLCCERIMRIALTHIAPWHCSGYKADSDETSPSRLI